MVTSRLLLLLLLIEPTVAQELLPDQLTLNGRRFSIPLGGPNSFGWEVVRPCETVVMAEGVSSGLKSALRYGVQRPERSSAGRATNPRGLSAGRSAFEERR